MSSIPARLRALVAVSLIVASLVGPAYAGGKPKQYSWSEAARLEPGTAVVLTVTGGAPAKVRLWHVADATLVTSAPTAPPKLSHTVRTMLTVMGANWLTVMDGREYRKGQVRVSPDGVFEGEKKVAELAQVVQFTARDRVVAIEKPSGPHTRLWVLIGVAVFFLVASFIGRS